MNIKKELVDKFKREGKNTIPIPLMNGDKTFQATLLDNGISVDNLANQPILPWTVFEVVINLLEQESKSVIKGDGMNSKLGSAKLPINSVEGIIAHKVYDKKNGDSVFRRVSPVCAILDWVGVCENKRGYLVLSKK